MLFRAQQTLTTWSSTIFLLIPSESVGHQLPIESGNIVWQHQWFFAPRTSESSFTLCWYSFSKAARSIVVKSVWVAILASSILSLFSLLCLSLFPYLFRPCSASLFFWDGVEKKDAWHTGWWQRIITLSTYSRRDNRVCLYCMYYHSKPPLLKGSTSFCQPWKTLTSNKVLAIDHCRSMHLGENPFCWWRWATVSV